MSISRSIDSLDFWGHPVKSVTRIQGHVSLLPHPPSPDACVELENEDDDKDVDYKNELPLVLPESTGSATLRSYCMRSSPSGRIRRHQI
jgi:hypothetical protein